MKPYLNKAGLVALGLVMLMAATRFNHFGSALTLPDASLAVFFLGGLLISKYKRFAAGFFVFLLLQAGLTDYFVTSLQGNSDWCITPAYCFLIPTYASLWLAGHWFQLHHSFEGKGLLVLGLLAWAANSFAFMLSNTGFYLFSGYFSTMGVTEFAGRVAQYYVSYVSVAMLYIACVIAIYMVFHLSGKQSVHSQSA